MVLGAGLQGANGGGGNNVAESATRFMGCLAVVPAGLNLLASAFINHVGGASSSHVGAAFVDFVDAVEVHHAGTVKACFSPFVGHMT